MEIDNDASRKQARETTEIPTVSDVMMIARSIWYPTNPYKQHTKKEEDRDFREWFGCGAHVCLKAYTLLIEHSLLPPGGQLRHLLWALFYWKSDGKKRTLSKICGDISKDTLWKWSRLFAEQLALLKASVVSACLLHLFVYILSLTCSFSS